MLDYINKYYFNYTTSSRNNNNNNTINTSISNLVCLLIRRK